MPELPDVETLRRYLEATALHQTIAEVEVDEEEDQLFEHTSVEELRRVLLGAAFDGTGRHGKYLFVTLEPAEEAVLALHFGMTGGLSYFEDAEQMPAYSRLIIRFQNGYHLVYHSMRKLGEVRIVDDADRFVEKERLGPDALSPAFDLEAFEDVIDDRAVMAKALFLDQHSIAGLGNVYADEILFQSGVHPRTKVDRLSDEEVEHVFDAMKQVLRTATEHGARPDRYPSSFITPHRHPDGHCPRCGAELARVKVSSRSSYYCPNRQGERA